MARGIFGTPFVRWFNAAAVGLRNAPVLGRFIADSLVVVRYVGRRSGQTFETPVSIKRSGKDVTIHVMAPDSKNWWRNFLGAGAPITLVDLDGQDRSGHAVANRDDRGRVSVRVKLD
ncbi:hypothetical protein [Mycobacterium hubeiense]|uniref:hypothetical protein n=1 Tax=Mycobacterium hubeiense TaxID=1867256 RepID=UPI000C7E874F|nr:hypothetical protein [Mycobacterium sp. QGD 101]